MRLLLCATLVALAIASPSYADDECQSAQVEMAKTLAVMQILAAQSGSVDPKTLQRYIVASDKYFFCQKTQAWTLAVAPGMTPKVIAQTQGRNPPP